MGVTLLHTIGGSPKWLVELVGKVRGVEAGPDTGKHGGKVVSGFLSPLVVLGLSAPGCGGVGVTTGTYTSTVGSPGEAIILSLDPSGGSGGGLSVGSFVTRCYFVCVVRSYCW